MYLESLIIKAFNSINFILHKNKRVGRQKTSKSVPEINHNYSHEKQTTRKVYEIAGLKVISENRPREMTERTVVKYSVANWKVRGHTRTYKSGKVVYIEPHTATRKNMGELTKKVKPAAKTIVVKDE